MEGGTFERRELSVFSAHGKELAQWVRLTCGKKTVGRSRKQGSGAQAERGRLLCQNSAEHGRG